MRNLLSRLFSRRERSAPAYDKTFAGNAGAPTLLIFTEHLNATYFISFEIPLLEVHQQGDINFSVVCQQSVSRSGLQHWVNALTHNRPDAVVMTRYGLPFGPPLLDACKALKIPVIYHIDDYLLEIPHSLGAQIQKAQGDGAVIDARRYLLQHCDLIYASTAHLAQRLQAEFPQQAVYHGMYAPYMGARITPAAPAGPGWVVGYMGSKGHQEDLELVVPALERLLEAYPTLRFEVFGTIRMPQALLRFGERVASHKVNQAYGSFLQVLAGLGWTVGLAPLVDEPFNLCKAPTKFIEYTAAGIAVVAAGVPVYADVIPAGAGVLVDDDWYSAIEQLLHDEPGRRRQLTVARDYCSATFSEHRLQQQVMAVLARVNERCPAI